MNNTFKNLAVWLVIGLVLMTVFNQFNARQVSSNAIDYSQFIEEVRDGRISKVVMEGRTLKATTNDGKRITYASDGEMAAALADLNRQIARATERISVVRIQSSKGL